MDFLPTAYTQTSSAVVLKLDKQNVEKANICLTSAHVRVVYPNVVSMTIDHR